MSTADKGASQTPERKVMERLNCRCGQIGTATWGSAQPGTKKLLELSAGFYERFQKQSSAKTEIVCAVCDQVVKQSAIS